MKWISSEKQETVATLDVTEDNWILIFHIVDRLRCYETLCSNNFKYQVWYRDSNKVLHQNNLHPVDFAWVVEKEYNYTNEDTHNCLFGILKQHRETGDPFALLLDLPCYFKCNEECKEQHFQQQCPLLLLETCFRPHWWHTFGPNILLSMAMPCSGDMSKCFYFLINKGKKEVWWVEVEESRNMATLPQKFSGNLPFLVVEIMRFQKGVNTNLLSSTQEFIFHNFTNSWLQHMEGEVPSTLLDQSQKLFSLASLFNWCLGEMLHPLGKHPTKPTQQGKDSDRQMKKNNYSSKVKNMQ